MKTNASWGGTNQKIPCMLITASGELGSSFVFDLQRHDNTPISLGNWDAPSDAGETELYYKITSNDGVYTVDAADSCTAIGYLSEGDEVIGVTLKNYIYSIQAYTKKSDGTMDPSEKSYIFDKLTFPDTLQNLTSSATVTLAPQSAITGITELVLGINGNKSVAYNGKYWNAGGSGATLKITATADTLIAGSIILDINETVTQNGEVITSGTEGVLEIAITPNGDGVYIPVNSDTDVTFSIGNWNYTVKDGKIYASKGTTESAVFDYNSESDNNLLIIPANGVDGLDTVMQGETVLEQIIPAVTKNGNDVILTVKNPSELQNTEDTLDLCDSSGKNYGSMKIRYTEMGISGYYLTLNNPGDNSSRINKLIVEDFPRHELQILAGGFFNSSTSFTVEGANFTWIFLETDDSPDITVERVAENFPAKIEIFHNVSDSSITSAQNAKFTFDSRILLSDGTYVESVDGSSLFKADADGNLTLIGGCCFTNGVVPIYIDDMELLLYDNPNDTNSDWAQLMCSDSGHSRVRIEKEFKGSYDGRTQTISVTQGAFQILVDSSFLPNQDEQIKWWHSWYTYVVNEADHSIDVYYEEARLRDEEDGEIIEEISTTFVAKRQYSDISNVSFTRLDDPSAITTLANFGLNGVIDPSATDDGEATDPTKPVITPTTPGRTKTLETYDVDKDIIELSQETGSLDPDKIIVSENGTLTYGTDFANGKANNGAVDLSESEKQGYYMARIADKDGNNKRLVVWSGTEGSTIDLSRETKGAVLKDSGNGKKDRFIGGSGRDDISIGMDDEAIGGKGSDLIKFGRNADGAKLGIGDGDGHDVAKGFSFGFDTDSNVVHILDGQGLGEAGVDSLGRLKVGSARVEFSGTNLAERDQTNLLLEDSRGTHKVAIGKRMDAKSDLADIYYGTASDAEVDFTGFGDGHLLIDLGNSGSYGRSVAEFYGVKQARGAKGADNDIAGADNVNNVLIGGENGRNRLYGGKGGNDHLVGNRTSEDTFYFGADSGNDTIQDYTEEDTVSFLGGSIDHAYVKDDGILKMYWKDEAGNESRLTFDGDMKDYVITYDLGDGKHGAKFGSRLTMTDDTADFVNYYNSGRSSAKGELEVSGYANKAIWLDGSHNVTYEGFQIVDASGLEGDAELAGSSRSDLVIGGSGRNSLWGGAGGNDTLKGGSGWNEFYFGMGEGRDTINGSNADDRVMLYNVSLGDINLKGTGVRNGSMVISLNDGSSLTIEHYGSQGPSTFRLSDGAWSYDKSAGTWKESR